MLRNLPKNYVPKKDLLRGRTILVTGAGDGIGRVAAEKFARHGATILLLGRTRQKLEEVSDAIRSNTDTDPLIIPLDLMDLSESVAHELRDTLSEQYEKLDGLLHNASILGAKVPIASYPIDDWHAVVQVNLTAQFVLTKALLPLLECSDDASILFTSSGVGRKGRAYWGAYAVTKFATEGLTEVLADELEEISKIRVNSINPGGTRTGMRASAYPAEDPMTLPTPDEHMNLYLYLVGPDSVGVTNQKFET